MASPKIDVRIPYEPNGRLGWDYNRIMEETVHDWVLFLDHDVMLSLNPNWYHICQVVIENHPQAGVFSCRTNAHHSDTGQQDPDAPSMDAPMIEHQEYARTVWNENGYRCSSISKISGFFMLVRKEAWNKAGGFPGEAMFKEDWRFTRGVASKGYQLLRIDGLYVFHMKHRVGSFIEGQDTTKEILDKRRR